jgi:predicted Zn-dependent protease
MGNERNMKIGKPIIIMNEDGVSDLEKEAVTVGIKDILEMAEVRSKVEDIGVWRSTTYCNEDGSLKNFQSIDWYLQKGREESRNANQLNVQSISMHLQRRGTVWKGTHRIVLVLCSDIYYEDKNFVVGLSDKDSPVILSTFRFKGLSEKERCQCLKTVAMHELGHMFGLPSEDRDKNVENKLGKHCTNRCIMRQGLDVSDWLDITDDRLKYGALCSDCINDLKSYFGR